MINPRNIVRHLGIFTIALLVAGTLYPATPADSTGQLEDFENTIEENDSSADTVLIDFRDDEPSFFESLFADICYRMGRWFFRDALPEIMFGESWGELFTYDPLELWELRFASYPYATQGGLLTSDLSGKQHALQLRGYGFYHSRDLTGLGLRARFYPFPFGGVEYHRIHFTERLSDRLDHLTHSAFFVNVNRIRHERVMMAWGLGVTGVERRKFHFGPALNLSADIYPVKPVSLHWSYNIGGVNQSTVTETQLTVNLHYRRGEFGLGYQSFGADEVTIRGMTAGIGFYF